MTHNPYWRRSILRRKYAVWLLLTTWHMRSRPRIAANIGVSVGYRNNVDFRQSPYLSTSHMHRLISCRKSRRSWLPRPNASHYHLDIQCIKLIKIGDKKAPSLQQVSCTYGRASSSSRTIWKRMLPGCRPSAKSMTPRAQQVWRFNCLCYSCEARPLPFSSEIPTTVEIMNLHALTAVVSLYALNYIGADAIGMPPVRFSNLECTNVSRDVGLSVHCRPSICISITDRCTQLACVVAGTKCVGFFFQDFLSFVSNEYNENVPI